ncbi:DUF4335 domain-containing protein [Mastigocoleus testarum]|uniref:DUF4335 domain-containing protein n=1 Tax=Mastigocoleus testarum BC008 TaxID=371196 RepID=A0A0V7ZDR8_9CYAN|nr:DUF4335 domain-containing protein [Mastigocoleus testarum]KST62677.1 hypothetical protein BC008_38265 [Mastigocoleus testarum BC008]
MPLSNPVIRRYTPPTCTLEIWAQKSPISRWAKQSVLKQLTFELQLDDPRLSEEDKVTIRGDREQLEALCTKVSDYVQELLQKDTENFWLSFQGSQVNNQVEPPPDNSSNTSAFAHNPDPSVNNSNSNTDNSNSGVSQASTGSIHLQPHTHLKHKLFLGSLTNRSTGEFVQLTSLQLFDLASALENYSAEFIALPMSTSSTSQKGNTWSSWGPVAAVVAVAAGLTPVTWQYANSLRQQQVATTSSSQKDNVALNSSPLEKQSSSELAPSNSLPSIQPPLTSDLPLSVSPLPAPSSVSPQSGTAGELQQIKPGLNSSSGISANRGASSTFTKPATPKSNTLIVPGTQSDAAPNSSIKSSSSTQTNSQSRIGSNSIQSKIPPIPSPPKSAATPESLTNPITSNLTGTNLSTNKNNETSRSSSLPQPNIPVGSQTRIGATNTSTSLNTSTNTSANTSDLITSLKSRPGSNPKIATGNSDLLRSEQQVAEVKKYLKRRWQPPSGLKQSLEYSLTVGVDGTIERILPLGKAERENFGKTGIPAIGNRFISPSNTGQDTRIRAVFKPNGDVQAFPETD